MVFARRIGADLLARPADEPLWEALVQAVMVYYEGGDDARDGEWLAGLKLVQTAPATRGEYLKVASQMQQALADAIAVRTGTDLEHDMYPGILAGRQDLQAGLAGGAISHMLPHPFEGVAGELTRAKGQ